MTTATPSPHLRSSSRVPIQHVARVREGVLDWLESIRYKAAGWGRWPYNRHMYRPYGLQCSGQAIQILDQLGALRDVPASDRAEAIAFYQGCQDARDGYFKDPLVTEKDYTGYHTWEEVYNQWSGVSTALRLLGARPLHPLPRKRFVDLDAVGGRAYTRSFDWTNPWAKGEAWARGIGAYVGPREQTATGGGAGTSVAVPPVVLEAFETFEAEVLDRQSGYPLLKMTSDDPSRAMAGAFKTIGAYLAVGRPWPCPRQTIDSTLALQHADGEFGYRRNMCINWDALWVLREMDRQLAGGYRRADIAAAGNRLAERLLADYRKPDGGFAFEREHCWTVHHSIRLSDPLPESDMVGTSMCLKSLSYADEWNAAGEPPAEGDREEIGIVTANRPLRPLPLGSIQARGWLKQQLRRQADGLSGCLDEFWRDIRDSGWIGGAGEGWERVPYWLDGLVPLAFVLEDAGLKAKAQRWIDHILREQKADGWLGPDAANPDPAARYKQLDVWPQFIMLKVLAQWQEATEDARVIPAMLRAVRRVGQAMAQEPLREWARSRWADLVWSIHWLIDRSPSDAAWLEDIAALAREQGLDWSGLSRDWPYKTKQHHALLREYQQQCDGVWINDHFNATHGVNVAMGLKAPAVAARDGDAGAEHRAARRLWEQLDRYHGQPSGMFSCDEHLAGTSPSQGTELCAVVEAMFSLEVALAAFGDPWFADRLEKIAYNALPATFKKDDPGGALWAHQYDQQANQVVCCRSEERVYTNNGPEANLFGLEPNFGCCLANLHQGWPKLVASLCMRTADDGLAVGVLGPCFVSTRVRGAAVTLEIRTAYPFSGRVELLVRADREISFPLRLRIPSWAEDARLLVEGRTSQRVRAGEFHEVVLDLQEERAFRIELELPIRPRLQERAAGDGVRVEAGPLVYALPIETRWTVLRRHEGAPSAVADWEAHPLSPWNYAIDTTRPVRLVDHQDEDAGFVIADTPAVEVQAARVPQWTLERNAAAASPGQAATTAALETRRLVPYGRTHLRVSVFPIVDRMQK